jgi:hypothetical protein
LAVSNTPGRTEIESRARVTLGGTAIEEFMLSRNAVVRIWLTPPIVGRRTWLETTLIASTNQSRNKIKLYWILKTILRARRTT